MATHIVKGTNVSLFISTNQKLYITQSACEKVTWVLYVFNASYGLPAPVEDTLQFFLEKRRVCVP